MQTIFRYACRISRFNKLKLLILKRDRDRKKAGFACDAKKNRTVLFALRIFDTIWRRMEFKKFSSFNLIGSDTLCECVWIREFPYLRCVCILYFGKYSHVEREKKRLRLFLVELKIRTAISSYTFLRRKCLKLIHSISFLQTIWSE